MAGEQSSKMAPIMTNQVQAQSGATEVDSDWVVYSDATMAGLSALIPMPFVDSGAERYFRLRMLRTIAARRGVVLHPRANRIVNRSYVDLWSRVGGFLTWPVGFAVDLAARASRKVLYFLAVKRAMDSLSYYWQRAYLLDYMVRQRHVTSGRQLEAAARALDHVLDTHVDSPLSDLARQVVGASAGIVVNLRRMRLRRLEPPTIRPKDIMRDRWEDYADYFAVLREGYDRAFAARLGNSAPTEASRGH